MSSVTLITAFRHRFDAFFRRVGLGGLWLICCGLVVGFVVAVTELEDLKFQRLSPAEHLRLALSACGASAGGMVAACPSPYEAKRQLDAVPANAREYEQSVQLRSAIAAQEAQAAVEQKKSAEASRDKSYQRFQANMAGDAHDPFTCAMSIENEPIISFDSGTNWWVDHGRCQTRLQKARDSDATASSYWSTTLRVDTDMDSSWLPEEERVCDTYPGDKGRVAVVACNTTGTHRDHNIPVKFWGGVDRNTVSSWRCRRESDQFVCRAVN